MRPLFVYILLLINTVHAQNNSALQAVISDCGGATMLSNSGNYSVQFTGTSGNYNELKVYPALKEIKEKNGVWFLFKAEQEGRFNLNATATIGTLQLAVFAVNQDDHCNALQQGKLNVIRKITSNQSNQVSISVVASENNAYPIDLKKNEKILIFINSSEKKKHILSLSINFETIDEISPIENTDETSKVIDLRKGKTSNTFQVQIRDYETGKPIVADLTLGGMSENDGKHTGSDFYFPIAKSGKVDLKCDALGYFFNDRQEPVSSGSDHELVIYMYPVGHGKSFKIEEIEFISGSARFMPASDAKLIRLKDFLVLNSGVKVEIQGHVNAIGEENSSAAMKLSKERAKMVYNYLHQAGISKKRMKFKGYGGTAPVYEKPKYSYEDQANRRVEIKILD